MRIIIAPTLHATLRINQNYLYKVPSTANLIIVHYYTIFLFLTLIYLTGRQISELWIEVWKDKASIKGQNFIRPSNNWTLFINFIKNYMGSICPWSKLTVFMLHSLWIQISPCENFNGHHNLFRAIPILTVHFNQSHTLLPPKM